MGLKGYDRLNKAKKVKNDEYYTTKEHVEIVFNKYLKDVDFTNKIIYCPCDSDESEFVKYLKDNKLMLNYKELWYTSDDYNNHIDLFNTCDYIITNPPFSKLNKEFIPILKYSKKLFFIFGSKMNVHTYYKGIYDIDNCKIIRTIISNNNIEVKYKTIDNKYIDVSTCYITNIKEVDSFINHKPLRLNKSLSELNNKVYIKDILQVNYCKDIPYDYNDYVLVPETVLFSENIYMFNICNNGNNYKYVVEDCSDNRMRYYRYLVKIKPEYLHGNNQ